MSEETPETDAAAFNIQLDGTVSYHPKGGYVGRGTCESLERRLNAALADAQVLAEIMSGDRIVLPVNEAHAEAMYRSAFFYLQELRAARAVPKREGGE